MLKRFGTAGGQHLKEFLGQVKTVCLTEARDPFVECIADDLAFTVVLLRQGQPAVVDAPGDRGVLGVVSGKRPHNPCIRYLRGKQVADDAEGWEDAHGLRIDPLEQRQIKNLRTETRTVQKIEPLNPGPFPLAQQAGGIEGKIAPLGMPADVPVPSGEDMRLRIAQRQLLRLGPREADHKIFLPACQRIVGAAVGEESKTEAVLKADRGELKRRVLADSVNIIQQTEIAEAPGGGSMGKKLRIALTAAGDQDAKLPVFDQLSAVADAGALGTGGKQRGEIKVGKRAENHRIFIPKAGHRDGEILHPPDVITEVVHVFCPPCLTVIAAVSACGGGTRSLSCRDSAGAPLTEV